MTRAGNLKH